MRFNPCNLGKSLAYSKHNTFLVCPFMPGLTESIVCFIRVLVVALQKANNNHTNPSVIVLYSSSLAVPLLHLQFLPVVYMGRYCPHNRQWYWLPGGGRWRHCAQGTARLRFTSNTRGTRYSNTPLPDYSPNVTQTVRMCDAGRRVLVSVGMGPTVRWDTTPRCQKAA